MLNSCCWCEAYRCCWTPVRPGPIYAKNESLTYNRAYYNAYHNYLRYRPEYKESSPPPRSRTQSCVVWEEEQSHKRSKSVARIREYATERTPITRDRDTIYSGVNREPTSENTINKKKNDPTQTVEIVEHYEDGGKKEDTLGARLAADGTTGYIDTIINYDEKEGELNIANIVKIGDKYIKKEWECGDEFKAIYGRSKSAGRNSTLKQSTNKRATTGRMDDTLNRRSPLRCSKNLFEEDSLESVEPNPTFRGTTKRSAKAKTKFDHWDWELWNEEGEIFFNETRPFSSRRKSLKRKKMAYEPEIDDQSEEEFRNTTPHSPTFRRSALRKSNRSKSQKSVSFRRSPSPEFNPNYSLYDETRRNLSPISPQRRSASFARSETPSDDDYDEADFEEMEFSESIPGEANKKSIRASTYIATKDKTRASTRGQRTPKQFDSDIQPRYRMTIDKRTKQPTRPKAQTTKKGGFKETGFKTNDFWTQDFRNNKKKIMERESTNSIHSSSTLKRGSRANHRQKSLKDLAIKLKKYGELERQEMNIRNTLWMQRNYNAGFAFQLLNPVNGIVNCKNLHAALKTNLRIDLVEKDVVMDIIERLAYINEQELLLSDMIFFEPGKHDESYYQYRRNFSYEQDEDDTTWYPLFKEFWKALMNTVKQRRIVQKEMCDIYPEAIDYLYEHFGLGTNEKFSREEVENFINEQLSTELDQELLRCIMESLDRDQDNLVSYQEFCDAFYGAE